jgi:hypothetical protein
MYKKTINLGVHDFGVDPWYLSNRFTTDYNPYGGNGDISIMLACYVTVNFSLLPHIVPHRELWLRKTITVTYHKCT